MSKETQSKSWFSSERVRQSQVWSCPALFVLAIFGGAISLTVLNNHIPLWKELDILASKSTATREEALSPTDYLGRAKRILRSTPLIDGHNDFPFLLRQQLHSKIYDHDFESENLGSHTDFQKMREGMVGGQFWSVFVPCPDVLVPGIDCNAPSKRVPDLNEPNWAVRDTLEQIDITKRLVANYPELFELCTEPACVRKVHSIGKIASMIGVEGGHQTGNSLGALRLLFEVGVRYVTVTHNCDNAFATSWVSVDKESGKNAGLTSFGQDFVLEMNRLGMMVDLSHVSPQTMRDVLLVARAPVIFSHSGAYGLQGHLRNVPDDVLEGVRKNGGIVMVPAISVFINWKRPEEASIEDMVDHILWIARIAGWDNVGLGSDFDGSSHVIEGVEDVSKWPNLIARLLARGVTDRQVKQVVGENLLRVWEKVETVAHSIQGEGEKPNEQTWEGRLWEPECFDVPRLFPD